MVRRRPIVSPGYHSADENFVTSGSRLFDLVLGGGWGRGRVVNIVGDRSTGKTQLAIEAAACFAQITDPENIRYAEAEAAFDREFGEYMGMPRGVQFTTDQEMRTVEQWHNDLRDFIDKHKRSRAPMLYILDSLDALSDDAELKRDIDEGSYGAAKAKRISEMFRRVVADLRDADCTLFIISQIRDKIGVTFGETKTRSGGRALDFYASQIVWLAEIGKIQQTVLGVKRPTGIEVLARTKKNKVGMPFRNAKLTLSFGYGIDDELSMIAWLEDNKAAHLIEEADDPLTFAALKKQLSAARRVQDRDTVQRLANRLADAVTTRWNEIEAALRPPMRKYT